MENIKIIKNKYEECKEDLKALNQFMYENPELGRQEYKAKEKHLELLLKNGFKQEELKVNIPTAYKVSYENTTKPGLNICFMAEYDALPGIGHGCGHNILGTASVGAGITLKNFIDIYGGKVTILGTPAEESDGAKVDMCEEGDLEGIDVVMISHPTSEHHYKSDKSRAMEALEFTFTGKSAHAAGDPYNGINALDAAVNFYTMVNSIKHQTKVEECVIHGIISQGGLAANIVPEKAVLNYYVRANTTEYMEEFSAKIKQCAKGVALASGTEVEIRNYEYTFKNLITNEALMDVYEKNMNKMGIKMEITKGGKGSTDAGNVSHVCPTIHTYFPISKNKINGHSIAMADSTVTEVGYKGMEEAITAMCMTGIDLLNDKTLYEKISKEFKNLKKNNK